MVTTILTFYEQQEPSEIRNAKELPSYIYLFLCMLFFKLKKVLIWAKTLFLGKMQCLHHKTKILILNHIHIHIHMYLWEILHLGITKAVSTLTCLSSTPPKRIAPI
jgi:hypothetical protein